MSVNEDWNEEVKATKEYLESFMFNFMFDTPVYPRIILEALQQIIDEYDEYVTEYEMEIDDEIETNEAFAEIVENFNE